MRLEFKDDDLKALADAYAGSGMTLRVVGGAVRDMLLGLDPKDVDVASDATPQETMEIAAANGLRTIPTGLKHGTVTVVVGKSLYEVTTLREDVETDGRHATVSYVRDFRTDAARRDFTVNAMSADLDGTVHDYFDGLADLAAGRVRFVGAAEDRMTEDYLRILRLFRFRARFRPDGLDEDEDELAAVARCAPGLDRISGERIWQETSRILGMRNGGRELDVMRRLGVDRAIGSGGVWDTVTADAVRRHGGSPAACLGVLLRDAAPERWRLSRAEQEASAVAAAVACDPQEGEHAWLCRAVDGLDPAVLVPVLHATGRHGAANAIRAGVPAFPVRGRDLAEAGVEPGPGMGSVLSALRQAWKDSNFEMGRDELVASLGAQPRP